MTAEEILFVQQLQEERGRLFPGNANFKGRLDEGRREAEYSAILQSTSLQAQKDYYEQRACEAVSVLSGKESWRNRKRRSIAKIRPFLHSRNSFFSSGIR